MSCPNCSSDKVESERKLDIVHYGDPLEALLYVVVPVYTCQGCKFAWTDAEAESIIDATVKEYLAEKEAEKAAKEKFTEESKSKWTKKEGCANG